MQTVWLILGTLVMGLATAYFVYQGTQVQGAQYFYWITAAITGVAFISYLMIATGAGSIVLEEGRQFYYFRYIAWLIITPLLLLDLALLTLARPGRNVGLIAGLLGLDAFLILDVLAKIGFGFLLLSNHQTLQEVGGGGAQATSRVR